VDAGTTDIPLTGGVTLVNRPKIKGTRFETDVVNFLKMQGWPEAERRALAGGTDKGDIINAGPYTWEAKATKAIDLAGGVDELKQEIENAQTRYGFLIVKRRNKSTSEAYAVMTLEQLCEMLRDRQ
jgi:Holliday junction resolvase